MTRNVVVGPPGGRTEYASGRREVARQAHLRQEIADIDLRRDGPITKESRRAA